jgi:hypothetical protein
MIGAILQTSFRALRRDRGAFVMSFILPIGFFTIFWICVWEHARVVDAASDSAGSG